MVTQAPKRSAVLMAVAFCLSCIGLAILVWTQFSGTIPFAPAGYRIHAVFPETGQLVPGADVRVSGVDVGKVTGVQPEGVNSLVTMDVRQKFSPIPADTHAILRLKTLLGEAYIALSSGDRASGSLPDGGTIPRNQVEATQNLDQVLNSFDPSTQKALQQLLNGTFTALSGRGQDLNDAVGNLDPAVTDLNAVVGVLNQQQGNVQGVVNNLGSVLTTLGNRSSDLQTVIAAGDQVFSATAARDAALTATVNGLPPFMTRLRATLTTLNGTLGIAKPTLAVIKGAAPLVRPALSELAQLSAPALSLLHQAPSLVRDANTALPSIARFTVAFNGTLQPLLGAARQVIPVINLISQFSRETGAGFLEPGRGPERQCAGQQRHHQIPALGADAQQRGPLRAVLAAVDQPAQPVRVARRAGEHREWRSAVLGLQQRRQRLGDQPAGHRQRPLPATAGVSVAFERGVERPELLPAGHAGEAGGLGTYTRSCMAPVLCAPSRRRDPAE